jgi:quercetin dioxygenase-like cupin family protein
MRDPRAEPGLAEPRRASGAPAALHALIEPVLQAGLPWPPPNAAARGDAFAEVLDSPHAGASDALLHALSAALPASVPAAASPRLLRRRLLERMAKSAAASRTLHTRRHADTLPLPAAGGVTLRTLYLATGDARRPGEPDAVALVELAPGARWAVPGADTQREWLVLRGSLTMGGTELHAHDYHVVPAGREAGGLASAGGALLYQRESRPEAGAPEAAVTQAAASADWADFAPGIKRRLLWQQGGQAAMLYHALPGAAVPHHGHGHDEECLMLAGDFFLDDVLLRELDYQIAPAGSEHRSTNTDTGLVVFAHGDVEMELR